MSLPSPALPAPAAHLAGGEPARAAFLAQALRLEWFTVAWNLLEGLIAMAAAWAAGSVVLWGFGLDSAIETASGAVLVWRLRQELRGGLGEDEVEELERRAGRWVAAALGLLALWVAFDALRALLLQEKPEPSWVGCALTAVSLLLMWALARSKKRLSQRLASSALAADAFQTTACWWLSLATLGGLALNLAWGWWWADPLAALAIAALVATEARRAWHGHCC